MNRSFLSVILIFAVLLTTACSAKIDKSDDVPQIIEADIILPEKIAENEEHTFKVKVTQGQEKVEDADDVQFEIWKANHKEQSELIRAKYESDGIYTVNISFKENGVCYVQTHVTARGLHVMPTKQFVVGNVSEEELQSLKDEPQIQEQNHGHHH